MFSATATSSACSTATGCASAPPPRTTARPSSAMPTPTASPLSSAEGPEDNARDPFVIKIGDQWHCYYTATRNSEGHRGQEARDKKLGVVYARTSPDLKTWSDRPSSSLPRARPAMISTAAECPHVVEAAPGHYYLFRTQHYGEKAQTCVYHSTDPMDFGWGTLELRRCAPFRHHAAGRGSGDHQTGRPVVHRRAATGFEGHPARALGMEDAGRASAQADGQEAGHHPRGPLRRQRQHGQGHPLCQRPARRTQGHRSRASRCEDIRAGLEGYDALVFTGGVSGRQANTIGVSAASRCAASWSAAAVTSASAQAPILPAMASAGA